MARYRLALGWPQAVGLPLLFESPEKIDDSGVYIGKAPLVASSYGPQELVNGVMTSLGLLVAGYCDFRRLYRDSANVIKSLRPYVT